MNKKTLAFILILGILALVIAVFVMIRAIDSASRPESESSAELRQTGNRVYCFFIQSATEKDPDGDSEAIMLINLDHDAEAIRTVAVYSDTLMSVNDFTKIRTAYKDGGALYAVDTIENNLDISTSGYIVTDVPAVIDMIDALGGLDVDITDKEAELANRYVKKINDTYGSNSATIPAGKQTLNGVQTAGYLMSRCADGGEGQRTLLGSIAERYRSADESTRKRFIELLQNSHDTNVSGDEIAFAADSLTSYEIEGSDNYPKYKEKMSVEKLGECIVPNDLAKNAAWINGLFYGQTDYQPPENISDAPETTSGMD